MNTLRQAWQSLGTDLDPGPDYEGVTTIQLSHMLNIHRLRGAELFSLHSSSGIMEISSAITSVTA
jgi:hypothetical protein